MTNEETPRKNEMQCRIKSLIITPRSIIYRKWDISREQNPCCPRHGLRNPKKMCRKVFDRREMLPRRPHWAVGSCSVLKALVLPSLKREEKRLLQSQNMISPSVVTEQIASHNASQRSTPFPLCPISLKFPFYRIAHLFGFLPLLTWGLGLRTALIASSKTLFKFRCVRAEHSRYLCARISLATINAWS